MIQNFTFLGFLGVFFIGGRGGGVFLALLVGGSLCILKALLDFWLKIVLFKEGESVNGESVSQVPKLQPIASIPLWISILLFTPLFH